MLLNCDVGEDSWESLGLQGETTSPSWRKSILNVHWKDWCWSSSTSATWCEELTHWKRPWCCERLKAGGEGDDRRDGWMASPTQWTWVWANSGRWWRTGKPGMLQSMGSQRVGHEWAAEKQQLKCNIQKELTASGKRPPLSWSQCRIWGPWAQPSSRAQGPLWDGQEAVLRGQAWSWDQGHLSHTAGPEFIDEGAGCSPPHTPVFGTRSTPTSQHSALNPQDSGPLSALYLFLAACMVCGTLLLWPMGIRNLRKSRSLNHWTARAFSLSTSLKPLIISCSE